MKRLGMIVGLVFIFSMSMGFKCDAGTFDPPPVKSTEELYQDIFVSLLSVEIDRAINEYYKHLLNDPPTVYPFQVYIEKAERIGGYRSFEFIVTMNVLPVVGPHIQVGLDRLTFYINGSGQIKLTKFEHLKDYELPDHWKHILKN
ncbi:DUF3888 domain-containing protein [Bacillus sp. AK128]